ncbi:hypothetical protein DAEQUDRAFT_688583, partial [Daedalea quercina L-15889]
MHVRSRTPDDLAWSRAQGLGSGEVGATAHAGELVRNPVAEFYCWLLVIVVVLHYPSQHIAYFEKPSPMYRSSLHHRSRGTRSTKYRSCLALVVPVNIRPTHNLAPSTADCMPFARV